MSTAISLQQRLTEDLKTLTEKLNTASRDLQRQLELAEMEIRAEEIRHSCGVDASLNWLHAAYSDEDQVLDRQWRKSLPVPS